MNTMVNYLRFLFIILIFQVLLAPKVTAASSEKGIPLFFQADKNNIQILPQHFEYNLIDENQLKIGDILINYITFGFQILPSTHFPGKYRAKFTWPSSLLQEGSLLIKDNTGKAVWTANFNRRSVRLVNPKNNEQKDTQNKNLRTQVAEMVIDQLSAELIEDMKYFPFMTFCIANTTQETRIYFCSKELYLTSKENLKNNLKDNLLLVKARSQEKRTPLVEINGKNVTHRGIIFLNSASENIGFRAVSQSGAKVEVETRMKPVDFKDIVLSDDKKEIILTASGAEPVHEESIQRLSENEWRIHLDASRPILYLKGEGNIPMRQDFYIKGPIPSEQARPSLEEDSLDRIYRSEVSFTGTFAPGTSISSNPTAANEDVEKIDTHKFRWHLSEIPGGETSRHYLRVQHNENSFLAAYDLYRDYSFEAALWGAYWTRSGVYADIYLNWWIENFLASEAQWSRLHWGVNFKESIALTKKTGETSINISHLELLWRANPGFHFQNKTWGLSLPYEIVQGTGINISSFGIGFFYSDKAQKAYQKYLHWYDLKFNYFKNALQFQALAYYHLNKRFSWNYGLGMSQYSFDPAPLNSQFPMQFEARGGASYRF